MRDVRLERRGTVLRPPQAQAGLYSRIHALATATEHDVRCLLGLLLFLEQCHGSQGRVTGTHFLQELWGHSRSEQGEQAQLITQHPKMQHPHSPPETHRLLIQLLHPPLSLHLP